MKRSRKFCKRLMTLALAVVLCIGLAIPGFADEAKVEESVEVKITKILEMPEGTKTPNVTFKFKFEPFHKDGIPVENQEMPVIMDKTISFTSGDTGTTDTEEHIKVVKKETAEDILTGIDWNLGAGIYVYKVTEEQNNNELASNESMTYSSDILYANFYVENSKTKPGQLYVQKVIVMKVVEKEVEGVVKKVKIDTGLEFTNQYFIRGDDELKKAPVSISKTVKGDLANRDYYFAFNLTLAKPALVTVNVTYKAYVLEDDKVVTSTKNYSGGIKTDSEGKPYFEVTSGGVNFNLKHGQRLVFPDVHIGAIYTVEDKGAAEYTPSVIVTKDGVTEEKTGEKHGSLTTGPHIISNSNPEIEAEFGVNKADFTNTRGAPTPTGVIINNLPFIMALLLAAGAFVAFVVVKSRKRRASR